MAGCWARIDPSRLSELDRYHRRVTERLVGGADQHCAEQGFRSDLHPGARRACFARFDFAAEIVPATAGLALEEDKARAAGCGWPDLRRQLRLRPFGEPEGTDVEADPVFRRRGRSTPASGGAGAGTGCRSTARGWFRRATGAS